MVQKVQLRLGEASDNFTFAQITLYYEDAMREALYYTGRTVMNDALESIVEQMTVYKLNRFATEGLTSEAYSGTTYNYIDGYPDNIKQMLNKMRVVKTYG